MKKTLFAVVVAVFAMINVADAGMIEMDVESDIDFEGKAQLLFSSNGLPIADTSVHLLPGISDYGYSFKENGQTLGFASVTAILSDNGFAIGAITSGDIGLTMLGGIAFYLDQPATYRVTAFETGAASGFVGTYGDDGSCRPTGSGTLSAGSHLVCWEAAIGYNSERTFDVTFASAISEPRPLLLWLAGFAGAVYVRRRRSA